jgi:rod shape-determining protein MreC
MLEVVREPLNGVGRWMRGIDDIFVVYQENLRLKEEVTRLKKWQNSALVLEQRINRYQLLLNSVTDPSLSSVTAHVIGRANRPFLDTVILDAGKNQGIKPGEAVVDARGMIGRVYLVGDHTAWVILLTDLSSRIPVAIEPGHVQAILTGDNSGTPGLELSKQGAPLKDGAEIVTSGDGGLLPSGLAVGNVFWNGSEFRAALLADSTTADDVRILDLHSPPETAPTPGAGDLPVSAAGLAPLAHQPVVPPAAPQLPLTVPGTNLPGAATIGALPATKPGVPPKTQAQPQTAPAEEQDH